MSPLASFRFRLAHIVPRIGALPDMNDTGIKIDIVPDKAAQFRSPHSGEYRRYEERSPMIGGGFHQQLQFCPRWEIDAFT
jgi:hypothetical protein